jgi:AcrR family transcriptional regulator
MSPLDELRSRLGYRADVGSADQPAPVPQGSPGARRATGRRPGPSGTREAILAAAGARFAQLGFDRTTIRGVAADAGVDPALVHHFFGTKSALFAATMRLPVDPQEMIAGLLEPGLDGMGERAVRFFLGMLRHGGLAGPLVAMLRTAAGDERGAAMMREFFETAVLAQISARIGTPDAPRRVALCASQLLGLVLGHSILRLPQLTDADDDTLIAAYGPTLQRYLTGPLRAE